MTNHEKLLKLSGMAYHGGMYTAEEWEKITGVSPIGVHGIKVGANNGICYMNLEGREICKNHFLNVKLNWAAIGVSS